MERSGLLGTTEREIEMGLVSLFCCAICGRNVVDYDSRNGRDRHIDPVCRSCERHYGGPPPQVGAFMDRRKAVLVSALGNALGGIARCKEWERRYER